jgi:hypothetical protein
LEPTERTWPTADPYADQAVLQLLNSGKAQYALVATYKPGLGRRKWGLVYKRLVDPTWTMITEAAVPDDGSKGFAPLEEALQKLLVKAGPLMPNPPEIEPLPTRVAGVDAWVAMADALRAERLGDWEAALEGVNAAVEAAPQVEDFGILRAFYLVGQALEQGVELQPIELPGAEGASPELAGLHKVLIAMPVGREETQKAFAALVTSHPRSLRCYYLLGMWRWRFEDDPDGAAAALERAEELDESYEPARRVLDILRPDRHEADAPPDVPAARPQEEQ